MSDQLATEIRRLVDEGAPPITFTELELASPIGTPSRRRRRGWPVLAAAAAVVLGVILIAGAVLVEGSSDDRVHTPATDGQSPDATTVPTSPTTTLAVPGWEGLWPPEGTTLSAPPVGELVASVALIHRGAFHLYADGRLIWLSDLNGKPEWVEQRLTPEGIELVRSEFLATGLFDPAQASSEVQCDGVFRVCLRDGGRLLALSLPRLELDPRAIALLLRMRTLDSWLPTGSWADQQITKYAPARYEVCFTRNRPRNDGWVPFADQSEVLGLLPARLAELLGAHPATRSLDDSGALCFDDLTTEQARPVADEIVHAFGVAPGTLPRGRFDGFLSGFSVNQPEPLMVVIALTPLLPDGVPGLFPG